MSLEGPVERWEPGRGRSRSCFRLPPLPHCLEGAGQQIYHPRPLLYIHVGGPTRGLGLITHNRQLRVSFHAWSISRLWIPNPTSASDTFVHSASTAERQIFLRIRQGIRADLSESSESGESNSKGILGNELSRYHYFRRSKNGFRGSHHPQYSSTHQGPG